MKPIKGLVRGIKEGYRSGLEVTVGKQLTAEGVSWDYEPFRIPYMPQRVQNYTPDFIIRGNNGNELLIETKGRFVAKDRTKHLLLKDQYPDMDLRFVFSNPNQKLYKGSRTTYGQWCDKYGFQYAKGTIPREWFIEFSGT